MLGLKEPAVLGLSKLGAAELGLSGIPPVNRRQTVYRRAFLGAAAFEQKGYM